MLNASERQRYERQLIMSEISESGQTKIRNARIFIAGIGGLGSISAYCMTAMGVGRIRLVDGDRVELSNFECIFPDAPNPLAKPIGVLGPVPGLVASLQCIEAVKLTLYLDPSLMNRLLRIDGWNMSFKTTHLTRNEGCNACGNGRSCHVPEN